VAPAVAAHQLVVQRGARIPHVPAALGARDGARRESLFVIRTTAYKGTSRKARETPLSSSTRKSVAVGTVQKLGLCSHGLLRDSS
jgi:hypothetical protein